MPPSAGEKTRNRIMDTAEALILEKGYAATSVDQIIEKMEVTKGTFFYHFKKKDDLARALMERFAAADERLLRENMERAERLSDDPLQQLLIFVGLFIEMAEGLEEPHPGCLYASYCYESGLFDDQVHRVVADAVLSWREALAGKIRQASERHPPAVELEPESLADMMTVTAEGAFILTRVLGDRKAFARQLRHYRTYLRLAFGAPAA